MLTRACCRTGTVGSSALCTEQVGDAGQFCACFGLSCHQGHVKTEGNQTPANTNQAVTIRSLLTTELLALTAGAPDPGPPLLSASVAGASRDPPGWSRNALEGPWFP